MTNDNLMRLNLVFKKVFALHQAGKINEAIEGYLSLVESFPYDSRLQYLLGTAASQVGKYDLALLWLNRSLDGAPNNPQAHNNLGVTLNSINQPYEAIESYDRAIALNPDYAEAFYNKGNTLKDIGKLNDALESYDRAIALQSDHFDAYNNRGFVFQKLNLLDEALKNYDKAIAIKPDYAETLNNYGAALKSLGQFNNAVNAFKRAIEIAPKYAQAHNNLGVTLNSINQPYEAIESYDRAIALNPDYAEAFYNKGNTLKDIGKLNDALESYDRAIALQSDHFDAYNNRGRILKELNQFDKALESYDRAIALKPDYAEALLNKSIVQLLLGNFKEGWENYEWRWSGSSLKGDKRNFNQPLWTGNKPIQGKTILVYGEQGLGDIIQFSRYIPLLHQLGSKIIFEVPESLLSIMKCLDKYCTLITTGKPLPDFDTYTPLMSLPLAFKTEISSIPSASSYLQIDEAIKNNWTRKLGPRKRMRIGLAWAGNSINENDKRRSINFELFRTLFNLPLDFYSLQKECLESDKIIMNSISNFYNHQKDLYDFSDTAALIHHLDLVISVDTSVAHLAGALGKNVWILIPFSPDFRWMTKRSDSPWYPNATLFRQPQIYNWKNLIEEIKTLLSSLV
jgi:tetratricopeptide (TPR) repeat protein